MEGIDGTMQQLMSRKHKLMLQNNEIIIQQYSEMRVIEQSHAIEINWQESFLYEASKYICGKGYKCIKKIYINASSVFHKVLVEQYFFFDINNTQSQYVYTN